MRSKRPYAEVVFTVCTGDSDTLKFTGEDFQESKKRADEAALRLGSIATTGKPLADFQGPREDPYDWFATLPHEGHILTITVNKRSLHSEVPHLVTRSEFGCEHTRQEAARV